MTDATPTPAGSHLPERVSELFDPAQLESTAWLEVATNRLDVAWTKHWETQPEHVDPPVLTEEQVLGLLAELDKREAAEKRMRAIKDERKAEEMTYAPVDPFARRAEDPDAANEDKDNDN